MNASAHVRVLMLEADNVDSEGVGALVGVVREFRSGGHAQSVARATAALERPVVSEGLPQLPAKRPLKSRRKSRTKAPAGVGHCSKCCETGHNARSCTK